MLEMQSELTMRTGQGVEIAVFKIAPTMLGFLCGLAKALKDELKKPKLGEQSIKSLTKYGDKLISTPLTPETLKAFKSCMKKHGVDFSDPQIKSPAKEPLTVDIYFRAKDTEKIARAFKEHMENELKKVNSKKPLKKDVFKQAKQKVKDAAQTIDQTKNKNAVRCGR